MSSYYTPMQLQMLNWARSYHPDQLGTLRSMYSQVQPITQGTIQNAAQAALDQYQRNQAAPALAKEIASDGPNASSFAAARQAALQSQSALEGANIYNTALVNSNQNAIATQQAQQQQEQDAWNQWYGSLSGPTWDGTPGGATGGYSPYAGSAAANNLSGNNAFNKILTYGGQSLGNMANNFLQQAQSGQNPLYSLGQFAGGLSSAFSNPGASLASGWSSGRNPSNNSSSSSGAAGWGTVTPENGAALNGGTGQKLPF